MPKATQRQLSKQIERDIQSALRSFARRIEEKDGRTGDLPKVIGDGVAKAIITALEPERDDPPTETSPNAGRVTFRGGQRR